MKIKKGFVIRDVAGQTIVIATGLASEKFNGMIKLNKTGKEIWLLIEKGFSVEKIIEEMCRKYQVDISKVRADVNKIISLMIENGIVECD